MKKLRKPTTVGEILNEEFLIPRGMTQKVLAEHIGCDIKVINRIVNGRSSLSAEMALKFGAVFDMTPQFWLNAQNETSLYEAKMSLDDLPESLINAG